MISYKSPAKLNIFLDIVSKREDSYHNIVSLMVKIDLFDVVEVSVFGQDKVLLNIEGDAPAGNENICYQAADLMKKKFGLKKGIAINLKKIIPMQAGLGGGSSNAACVIRSMNDIFALGLSNSELMELGSGLGSDVPFFIEQSNWAIVEGRGEIVRPLKTLFTFSAVVILPEYRHRTADMYGRWKPVLTQDRCWDRIRLCSSDDIDMNFIKQCSYNVFEEVSSSNLLSKLKKDISYFGADLVRMTGSGSALYAVSSDTAVLKSIKSHFESLNYKAFLVKSLK
ncbi:MAG: 4-(cytidine 5'-diphospho)-2-C-methyl-D-erythritol kinase [Candidatus Omnitrophica bacterium]|nr:4-(cytidine 5'-diphospho)-2-C-methyl-D-erythritol kinase [Candidatus Omnitrophota bacterium]